MPTGPAHCADCHQPIRWTRTQAGHRLAVDPDPDPDPDGNTAIYRDGTGAWRSRRPTAELPITGWERLHMPHVATCPARQPQPQSSSLPAGVTRLDDHRKRSLGPARTRGHPNT